MRKIIVLVSIFFLTSLSYSFAPEEKPQKEEKSSQSKVQKFLNLFKKKSKAKRVDSAEEDTDEEDIDTFQAVQPRIEVEESKDKLTHKNKTEYFAFNMFPYEVRVRRIGDDYRVFGFSVPLNRYVRLPYLDTSKMSQAAKKRYNIEKLKPEMSPKEAFDMFLALDNMEHGRTDLVSE